MTPREFETSQFMQEQRAFVSGTVLGKGMLVDPVPNPPNFDDANFASKLGQHAGYAEVKETKCLSLKEAAETGALDQ